MSRLNDNERQTLMQLSQCHHEDMTSPRKRYDLLLYILNMGLYALLAFFASKAIIILIHSVEVHRKSGILKRL